MEICILEKEKIKETALVSVKKMNHIYELCYVQKRNNKSNIKILDKNNYVILATGEVKEIKHTENRSESKAEVSQSLKRLRDYINANVDNVNNCKWITLTYAENMTDTKRLYIDFKKFIMRFKYKYGHIEYIVAMEPQSRGAWHCHCIIIFDKKAPFIKNSEIAKLWQQGFTKTQKLDDIDNIGAYLTAYLGDMSLTECNSAKISYSKRDLKQVDEIGSNSLKEPKYFVKGARLKLYPPNFNIYRVSRGIKKPSKEYMTYEIAKEKAGLGTPTYSKALQLTDIQNNFNNKIIYEYYNTKRRN